MIKYILAGLLIAFNAKADIAMVDMNALIDKEIKCLADNIYFEARNESTKGQVAIALVTLNRIKSRKYPNSICKVVWQYKQFSWTIDGLSDKPRNMKAYEKAMKISTYIVESKLEGRHIPDFTGGATHYHANYVSPYWRHGLIELTSIDTHIFYKYKK